MKKFIYVSLDHATGLILESLLLKWGLDADEVINRCILIAAKKEKLIP